MDYGKEIHKHRIEHGLSQVKYAEEYGISLSMIKRLELGTYDHKLSDLTIYKLNKILNE